MANTPYIDLVKPAGTDKALISVLNANSDKIDSAVGGVQDALAIVCNGNTHGAITSGQYVYVRAHDTLQEGLYTANSNIAANAALSSSNLTANSSGGLNALNEHIVKYASTTHTSFASYVDLTWSALNGKNLIALHIYPTSEEDNQYYLPMWSFKKSGGNLCIMRFDAATGQKVSMANIEFKIEAWYTEDMS